MSDLAVEHRAALDLIYPLADALQIKLFYNSTKNGARIRGAEKMDLPISETETIPFEVKVQASAVGEDEAWVLARVRGNLWVLLGYLKQGRELQLCIVDSGRGRFGPVTADGWSGLTLADVSKKIGSGVVDSYYRRKEEDTWRQIDNIAGVDQGPAPQAAAGDRAADQAGPNPAPGS